MSEREKHGCEAAVVQCIDYRFRNYMDKWLDENFREKGKEYDLISIAGSTKDLEYAQKQIEISQRLHHINRLVLIHHEDCGAYGSESTPDRHAKDLIHAKSEVLKKYPDLKINLYYLTLDGSFSEIA